MVEPGVVDQAQRAWGTAALADRAQGARPRAVRDASLDQAIAEVEQATRRLARYQRKWLRRMPEVVTLDANRPAEEVADEIVALAAQGNVYSSLMKAG